MFYKATKSKVRKYFDKQETKIYLMSINYDENHFEKGTIGRALGLRYKMQDGVTLKFSENSEELEALYLDNKENFSPIVEKVQNILEQFIGLDAITIAEAVCDENLHKSYRRNTF